MNFYDGMEMSLRLTCRKSYLVGPVLIVHVGDEGPFLEKLLGETHHGYAIIYTSSYYFYLTYLSWAGIVRVGGVPLKGNRWGILNNWIKC